MNTKRRLTANDIIGKKIVSVYEKKMEKIKRFQNRMTFVHLNNGSIFNLDAMRDAEKELPLKIWSCEYDKSFVEVLSIERNSDLDSQIKAVVYINRDRFPSISTAILLENDFVLTVGIGEFDMGHDFSKPSQDFRDYTPLQIAS